MIDDFISTEIDQFIEDKDATLWICGLSNGMTVYQDDDRPDHYRDSWSRLRVYCRNNNVYVTSMKFKFRSHTEEIGSISDRPNISGFFFIKAALFGINMKKTERRYVGGYVEDGILKTKKFIVPELVLIEEEERLPKDYQDFIIPCINHSLEKNVPVSNT